MPFNVTVLSIRHPRAIRVEREKVDGHERMSLMAAIEKKIAADVYPQRQIKFTPAGMHPQLSFLMDWVIRCGYASAAILVGFHSTSHARPRLAAWRGRRASAPFPTARRRR